MSIGLLEKAIFLRFTKSSDEAPYDAFAQQALYSLLLASLFAIPCGWGGKVKSGQHCRMKTCIFFLGCFLCGLGGSNQPRGRANSGPISLTRWEPGTNELVCAVTSGIDHGCTRCRIEGTTSERKKRRTGGYSRLSPSTIKRAILFANAAGSLGLDPSKRSAWS